MRKARALTCKKGDIQIITYPIGKIDIAKDPTDTLNCYGSADTGLIEDFPMEDRRDLTNRREVLSDNLHTATSALAPSDTGLNLKLKTYIWDVDPAA